MAPDVFISSPAHAFVPASNFSPLILVDRLITLAQEADRAGYHSSALSLLGLIDTVLDGEGQG